MNHIRIIGILLVLTLRVFTLSANNCASILSTSEQLIEKQEYNKAIQTLQASPCQSSTYLHLLMSALNGLEQYAQIRQYSSSYLHKYKNDPEIRTTAYYWDAVALYHLKQYTEANVQINNAKSECKEKQSTTYAMICNIEGNIFESLKLYNNALECYQEVLSIYKKLPSSPYISKWQIATMSNIANIYIHSNNAKAEKYIAEAMLLLKKHPENTISEYLSLLNNMGQYYTNKKDYNNAIVYYKEIVEIRSKYLGTSHNSYGISLINLITSLYNNERYNETIPYIEQYLQFLRSTLQRNFTIMSESEREKYWNSQSQILDNLLVSATYAALNTKQADASLLYDICLLSKSLLLDTSIKMEQLMNNTSSQSIKSTYKELQETQQRLIKIGENNIHLSSQLTAKCDSLQKHLFNQLNVLQEQMTQLHIKWQDIQEQLTKNDIAVEFICLGEGEQTEYAVILLRNNWKHPKVYYLHALAETLDAKQISRLEMHNNSIFGNLVWQNIIDEIKFGDRIFFVPAGELQLMSAEYFTIREDYRMNDIYEMHRLSSTKQLLLAKHKSPHQKVALIGGMDYNASMEEIKYYANQYNYKRNGIDSVTKKEQTRIWLPLPGSLKEVQIIDSLLVNGHKESFLVTHDAATEGSLLSLSGKDYDIIHIATHGFYAEEKDSKMQKSGLAMAGANTLSLKPNSDLGDGLLTSAELSKLDLRKTQLTILSACQTGVGKVTTEGIFGLQRGFKMAGVRSMIVSLWEVNDAITATLMITFYKALLSGNNYYNAFNIAIDTIKNSQFHIKNSSISGNDIALFGAFVLVD